MLRLTCSLRIGKYQLPFASNVEVESSWMQLTDTAVVEVPRKLYMNNKPIIGQAFAVGDEVDLRLGYNDTNRQVFVGYVTSVGTANPIRIECEDASWRLKQKDCIITRTWEDPTLSDVLSYIFARVPDLKFVCHVNPKIGRVEANYATGAQVLEYLRKKGCICFFRGKTLHAGLAYVPSLKSRVKIEYGKNLIEANVEYLSRAAQRILVKATSIFRDNTTIKEEYGDRDGGVLEVYAYGMNQEGLKVFAKEQYERAHRGGFTGEFELFGLPGCQHGDEAQITNPRYPDQNGVYLIRKVSTRWGTDGFRQSIELDRRVS